MSFDSSPSGRQIGAAFLLTACGGLLFTLDLPLLRLSMADQWTMVFVRGLLLFATLSAGWLVARMMGDRAPFLAGAAGIAVAITSTLGNISYIGAVVHAPAANVVFLIALTPVIAASLSHLVLGEKVHAYTWSATILALCGAALITSQGIDSGHWVGDALAMTSAFCSATILTIIRATGRKVATSLALGSLASSLIALCFFGIVPSSLLGTGSFGMPLATVLLARGPRLLPSADVSMFFMLETILTPIWTWMLFAEVPSPRVLLGGLLLIVTLLAHSWWRLAVSLRNRAAPVPAECA